VIVRTSELLIRDSESLTREKFFGYLINVFFLGKNVTPPEIRRTSGQKFRTPELCMRLTKI
jgi:hypothetical protein